MAAQSPSMDQFEAYFQRADMDRDGRISGNEAVAFFRGTNLPTPVLAQIWTYADQNRSGFLGRAEFYNALKLVTVAQSKRELTADLVKAALYGPASAKIPAPQIKFAASPGSQSNINAGASTTPLSGNPVATQSTGASGPLGFLSQQTQQVRPPRPPLPSSGFQPHQGVASQGMSGVGAMNVPQGPSSSGWVGGRTDGSQTGFTSQNFNQSSSPSTTQGGFGPGMSSSPPVTQSIPQNTGLMQHTSSKPQNTVPLGTHIGVQDSKTLSVTGNGFASDSVFGDVFSVTSSQPKQNSTMPSSPASSVPASSSTAHISGGSPPMVNSSTPAQQPPHNLTQQFQPTLKANQHVSAQTSSTFSAASGNSIPRQSHPPWPRMSQADVQKYSKVFMQVDTDRDGKITGEQAKDLFLSWRLPREVLKKVWDLSDQDNDSKLSLREFCIALYLMERYREGRPLPTVFPSGVMFDETLLPASAQPNAAYGNTAWRPAGFQQSQGTRSAWPATSVGVGKPPRPVSRDDNMQPSQQKAKVPVLEKHLVDQLSTEEQDSLNTKFQEAKDAEKKVSELEKEILDAKEKIQFYHSKMQELILYKSRCDNRLNEITERVSGDKREADSLAKKYEEKYKQAGDVASKLTIEESTFRDIQEKKMELYRAIVKLEQGNADGIQDRANQIQLDLEQLVKALNERCKTYGLRGKPTSLVELPFGWQPGMQQGAADWDEVWDKFEDEGFTFVKELTLEVQNVIAPPKPKSSLFREKTNTSIDDGGVVKSPSNADEKSEVVSVGERTPKAEGTNTHSLLETARSPPDSPAGSYVVKSPSKEFQDPQTRKDINVNGSTHAFETHSEYGGGESVLSGDKGYDEPGWGSYDMHYDMDVTWDFNRLSTQDSDGKRRSESSLFGSDNWDLPPIKTGTITTDSMFPKQGPVFDSVPSTPITNFASSPHIDNLFPKQGPLFDSVPSTPISNFASSPHIDNIFQGKSQFAFADSVPSTPMLNSSNSPRSFSEGLEDHSFDSFSRFDSFNTHDSGPFASRETFTRFDSMQSTRDSDFDQGYFAPQESIARFDSFRSTADSEYGLFPPRDSFTRFDSMRSTKDSEYGHGFPSFDDSDPFGSNDPFKTSQEAQTPRRDSDSWKAF
ncbi:epidermal growth factor receptor substrate 15-like 1 isoform X1 [Olea europaea subsp. europaea]|uniref:Epidermal growth factor receptor substrate 15-like 1 isoform X1 n=1 Tax=Olea europaea subsp. europaea TaxID=158383 RepID=A0A8S0S9T6_OLEEU|nr:epidermal growth factor receptor substrate 15-like 1 isoform X1 [Olea europaea subsp. europaea]